MAEILLYVMGELEPEAAQTAAARLMEIAEEQRSAKGGVWVVSTT
jgi:hypothetical protein